jgi:hypothetical protein
MEQNFYGIEETSQKHRRESSKLQDHEPAVAAAYRVASADGQRWRPRTACVHEADAIPGPVGSAPLFVSKKPGVSRCCAWLDDFCMCTAISEQTNTLIAMPSDILANFGRYDAPLHSFIASV